MRSTFVVLLVLTLLPSTIVCQAATASQPATSQVATLVGIGNSFSGVGVLADFKPLCAGPTLVHGKCWLRTRVFW